jgi:Polysaccharide deacetylase
MTRIRPLSLLLSLALLMSGEARGEDWSWLKKPRTAFPGSLISPSSGCYPTGSTIGSTAITFTRTGSATYADAAWTVQSCPADAMRVDPAGIRVEPARTNLAAFNLTLSRRGTALVTRDGTLSPSGATHAMLLSTLGLYPTDDAYSAVAGFPNSVPVSTSFWLRRVSTSGTLRVRNPTTGTTGLMSIDLAQMPDGWVQIGTRPMAGVTWTTPFTSSSAGGAGVQFYAPTGTVSVYVAEIQQEAGPYPTGGATVYTRQSASLLTSPGDLTNAAWTKTGTVVASKDGTLAPDGVTQATKLVGVQTAALGYAAQAKSSLTGSTPTPLSFAIKRISTSGTLTVDNLSTSNMTIDLAQLPDAWVTIGVGAVAGVTQTEWTTTAGGSSGVRFTTSTGPLSFYVAAIDLGYWTMATRAAETLTIANPIADADTSWCIKAGSGWALGSGANSASVAITGTDLVFTVTDGASGTKTITQSVTSWAGPSHDVVACNAAGTLALYVDGMTVGVGAGVGTGTISTQPASLVVTETAGPTPKIAIARTSDPARVASASLVPSLYVSFTFDDGNSDWVSGVQVFDNHGVPASWYAIADNNYFLPAVAKSFQDRGHEIGSHGMSHIPMSSTQYMTDRLKREACDSRVRYAAAGVNMRTMAWPYGASDVGSQAIVNACGFGAARLTAVLPANGYVEVPSVNPMAIQEHGLASHPTLVSLQNVVNNALAHLPTINGQPAVLVFGGHHIMDGSPSTGTIEPATLDALLTWLATLSPRVQIKTFGDAMRTTLQPVIPSGTPPVLNGDMESYLAGTDVPDCWEESATGATAAWSRVAGRGGTGFAHQVVASSWTTGPVIYRLDTGAGAVSACGIPAAVGRTYAVTCWYRSDVPVRMVAERFQDSNKLWAAWTQSASTFPASPSDWAQATWTTPALPSGNYAISAGLGIVDGVCTTGCLGADNTATLIVDDCSAIENS